MVGKYEVEIYEDGDGSFYYIDPDSGEEVTCDEDGNSLSVPPIPKVQFVGAPEEWKELEKIDKYAEVEDYCENGIWDIDGIRDDLALMRGKLGIKVKRQESPRQGERALATASNYICSTCGKGYPVAQKWNRSPCCGQDMQPRDKSDVAPKPSPSLAPKVAAARKVAKKRKVRKKANRPAAPPDKSGGTSKMQELRELLEMKKEGLIDDDEFKQLKKEILGK